MTATLAAGLGARRTSAAASCPIVELRQYVMKPGGRDVLIEMFDRIFVDAQEAAGNTVLGQFRNLDAPDRFVWLRGFPDMASRPKALDSFYNSAIWQQHRNAANATMIDVDDVLLLHPLRPKTGLAVGNRPQDEGAIGIVRVTIYAFDTNVDAKTVAGFDEELEAAGDRALATYGTENTANNYPRLPIREGENVLVRIAAFPNIAACDGDSAKQALDARRRAKLKADPQVLRLAPTTRSLLHA